MVNPILAGAMDKIFILHADHEQNASTSTVRLAGSSGANPLPASPPASPRSGALRMAAPATVLNMLNEIGHRDNIAEYVAEARDRDDPFRLFGFGHRVYKNFDPRAKVLRETCHQVLDDLGIEIRFSNLRWSLRIWPSRISISSIKSYIRMSISSGIILKAMGFPTSMFTVLFAVARTVGWVAQWNEMITDPMQRIGRPPALHWSGAASLRRSRQARLTRHRRAGSIEGAMAAATFASNEAEFPRNGAVSACASSPALASAIRRQNLKKRPRQFTRRRGLLKERVDLTAEKRIRQDHPVHPDKAPPDGRGQAGSSSRHPRYPVKRRLQRDRSGGGQNGARPCERVEQCCVAAIDGDGGLASGHAVHHKLYLCPHGRQGRDRRGDLRIRPAKIVQRDQHRLQHMLDLGTPASRQQRDLRRFRQGRPLRVVIGRIESLGMSYEAGMHAKRREIVRLERKQAEQTVDGPRNAMPAPGAPCPDCRRDRVDDRGAPALGRHAALQPRGKPEGETFDINGHDKSRPRRHDLVDQPVGKARQARIGGKRGTESMTVRLSMACAPDNPCAVIAGPPTPIHCCRPQASLMARIRLAARRSPDGSPARMKTGAVKFNHHKPQFLGKGTERLRFVSKDHAVGLQRDHPDTGGSGTPQRLGAGNRRVETHVLTRLRCLDEHGRRRGGVKKRGGASQHGIGAFRRLDRDDAAILNNHGLADIMIAKGSQNVDTKFDIDPAGPVNISGKRPLGHPDTRHQAVRRQRFDTGFGKIAGYHAKEGIVAATHRLGKKPHRGGIRLQLGKRRAPDLPHHDHARAAGLGQLPASRADGAERHLECLESLKCSVGLAGDPEDHDIMALVAGMPGQILGKTPLPRYDRQPLHSAPYLCAA